MRLDAQDLKVSKDQRQALNRFNRYILGNDYLKEIAKSCPKSKQEAARRNNDFVLIERIHESELQHLETNSVCMNAEPSDIPGETFQKESVTQMSGQGQGVKLEENTRQLAGHGKRAAKPLPQPAHRFEVNLEVDNFTEEKYLLYENYQKTVHKEPAHQISRSAFKRFLCSSPLQRTKQVFDGQEQSLGSFHQCYRIDGRLVAIGVLDLLPQAVSAVYFMYHEDVHQWSFGKLSALREAALTVEGGHRWYMMGYYIHSCLKMRYKGDYHPQYILDPDSYTWDILDDSFKNKLETTKFVSLSREKDLGDSMESGPKPANEGRDDW